MVDRNRQKRWQEKHECDFSGNMHHLKNYVDGLIEKYGGDARVHFRREPYGDMYYYYLDAYEDETDQQMEMRIKAEEQNEKWQADRDEAEWKRLKKKFGETDK